MRTKLVVAVMGLAGWTGGCAPFGGAAAPCAFGAETAPSDAHPGVRVGEVRVVAVRVNPQVAVEARSEDGGRTVAVRFAHPRDGGALVHLDADDVGAVSPEETVPAAAPAAPPSGAVRVVLDGGRFLVCFRRGDLETGYHLMAQAWDAGGSPLSAPVPVSPPDADVYGAPQLVAVGDRRAIAAFPVFADGRAELLAVSLEVL